ncbi:hypothetical protein G9464_20660 [Halostella sp. JP-L12]|uniref:hypothetical protein n=1 Tax=Halostella TaxID=1843185 RepID=UPI000EF7847B|nr:MULTISPECIES: hypothetical protein [Halostella]NHN49984.1 hypothetical protein [Halostella sp. JP-L12]
MQSERRERSPDVECREDALASIRDAIASVQDVPAAALDEEKHAMLRSAAEDLGSLERALTNEVSQKRNTSPERPR